VNIYIETNISKDDSEIEVIGRDGRTNVPLCFEQVKYAALDASLEFKIARECFQLVGYNTHVDRLSVAPLEYEIM
jgi:hypothetical protein